MNIQDATYIGYFFSSNIPDLEMADNVTSMEISVLKVLPSNAEVEVFKQTIYAEEDGKIWLRDIKTIIDSTGIETFSMFNFVSDSDYYIGIFPSRSKIKGLNNNPSSIGRVIDTRFMIVGDFIYVEGDENLKIPFYLQNGDDTTLSATLYYKDDGQTKIEKVTKTLQYSYTDEYNLLKVSIPNLSTKLTYWGFKNSADKMISLQLSLTGRTINLVKSRFKPDMKLQFKNSFFQEQILNLNGIIERNPELDITKAFIGGKHKNIDVKDEESFVIRTAPLSETEVAQVIDMVKSDNIVWIKSNEKTELAVSEFKLTDSSDKTAFKSAEITFNKVTNWETDVELDATSYKVIFDSSFDNSFS